MFGEKWLSTAFIKSLITASEPHLPSDTRDMLAAIRTNVERQAAELKAREAAVATAYAKYMADAKPKAKTHANAKPKANTHANAKPKANTHANASRALEASLRAVLEHIASQTAAAPLQQLVHKTTNTPAQTQHQLTNIAKQPKGLPALDSHNRFQNMCYFNSLVQVLRMAEAVSTRSIMQGDTLNYSTTSQMRYAALALAKTPLKFGSQNDPHEVFLALEACGELYVTDFQSYMVELRTAPVQAGVPEHLLNGNELVSNRVYAAQQVTASPLFTVAPPRRFPKGGSLAEQLKAMWGKEFVEGGYGELAPGPPKEFANTLGHTYRVTLHSTGFLFIHINMIKYHNGRPMVVALAKPMAVDETIDIPGHEHKKVLVAAIVRSNTTTPDSSHYTAYVKHDADAWWRCDDAAVARVINPVAMFDTFSTNAYMLLYAPAPWVESLRKSRKLSEA
ncbi:hypothetical protein COO60DRAFT_1463566 [Scenedesmus sp. NREL 46B-D3]|nr:hypothetical protein COO60DRAFT_1463566 [Scenedesmus sp. NREL 46B-D3]